MARGTADQGFTLLEILVAFVIFAGVTIALQQAHIVGLGGIRTAQSQLGALELARSLMAGAGTVQRLRPDYDEWGDEGPYRWHLVARPYVAPEKTPPLAPQLEGFWTTVTVSWPSSRPFAEQRDQAVSLETLKLQAAVQ